MPRSAQNDTATHNYYSHLSPFEGGSKIAQDLAMMSRAQVTMWSSVLVSLAVAACSAGAPATPREDDSERDSGAQNVVADAGAGGDSSSSTQDTSVGTDSGVALDSSVPDTNAPPDTSTGDAAMGPDAGPDLGWGNQTNIEGIFSTYCAGCHSAQWATCWNVQANAANIYGMVSSGAMPRNGPMPAAVEMTLLDWLDADGGVTCDGTEPDGGIDASFDPPPGDGTPATP